MRASTTLLLALAPIAILQLACSDSSTEPLTEDELLFRGVIPSASIEVDGWDTGSEWAAVDPVAADSVGDSAGDANTDITELRIARSDDELFFRIDVEGSATLPPTTPHMEGGTAGFAIKFRPFNQAAIACSELEEGGDSLWIFYAEADIAGITEAAILTTEIVSHNAGSWGTQNVDVGATSILELSVPTYFIPPEHTRIKVFGVEAFWDAKIPEEEGDPVTGTYDTLFDVPFCMLLS